VGVGVLLSGMVGEGGGGEVGVFTRGGSVGAALFSGSFVSWVCCGSVLLSSSLYSSSPFICLSISIFPHSSVYRFSSAMYAMASGPRLGCPGGGH
jgi:hypothetical protein